MNDLQNVVWQVRNELECHEANGYYGGFSSFPSGTCTEASILLGIVLEAKGFGRFVYTSAEKGPGTHSWLENEILIIDITADQFDSCYPKVMILPKAENEHHLGFHITGRFPINGHEPIPNADYYITVGVIIGKVGRPIY